ncbi:hypothetical protein M3I53_05720 [Paraburkholderia sp. CNPSo 3272]|uniref:hypothetical protein n=1 Tax=Paraburkholderia sp. CNPSo 3272 TaxID=2940931 RepID=UPI0020B6AA98|nr:hypothetical protein [Paraburkholderia sp. CNPSo 3272]MCP3722634.1 hypothetical protein [Paraburkholderia sp. CNPSo 3272]
MSALPARHNSAKAKLAAGENLSAFMVELPSMGLVQALAVRGVGAWSSTWSTAPSTCKAPRGGARHARHADHAHRAVPWTEPWLVKTALEPGAIGVDFPMIATPELACTIFETIRYQCRSELWTKRLRCAANWSMRSLAILTGWRAPKPSFWTA